jgi:N-acylneuraminate cytidylyltransferase/CMP-N,N'-diacetyllegionaminic acid synthase
MEKKNVIGVILARGGSKGLPGKNTRELHGKPLIAYTIEAALKSGILDRVIVTTEDKEIAEVAKKHGAEVPFMRPAELAKDTAHTPPVIEHAAGWLEENEDYSVDYVVTLQPTSPLRKPEHIKEAVEKIIETGAECVVGVCETEYPPYWMMKLEGDRLMPFIATEGVDYFCLERQQLPKTYKPNGAIYVTRRDVLKEKGILISEDCRAILMDHESSLDVDTLLDFKTIELVMEEKDNGKN